MPISWEDLQKVSGIRTPTAGRITPVVDATPAQATQQPQNFVEKFNLLPTLGLLLGAGAGGLVGAPSGPGALATGAIGGGIGAAGGEALEQLLFKKPNLKGIAAEAAMGAAAGPIGRLVSIPLRGATGVITGASRKLIAQGLKISPTAFQKAAEAGVDLIKVYQRYAPKIGPGLDKPLGAIGKGATGTIDDLLKVAENEIQGSVKVSGAAKTFTVDRFKKELINQRNLLSKIPGNESKIESLNAFIKNTLNKYKGGLSDKQLLDIKRAADSKFGAKVLDELTGSVEAQGQKVLANAARSLLKGRYKNIADALDQEQELILLKKVIGATRGKVETAGFPTGGLTAPLESLLSSVGRTVPAVTGFARKEIPRAASNIAETGAIGGLMSLIKGTDVSGPVAEQEQADTNVDKETQNLLSLLESQQTQQQSRYPLENFLADVQRDPKHYSTYESLYEILNKEQKLSANAANQQFAVNSAQSMVDQLEQVFTDIKQPESGLGARLAGFIKKGQAAAGYNKRVKTYESIRQGAASRVIRALGEVGVLTDTDVKRSLGLLPSVTDSAEEAADKFNELRTLLQAQMGGIDQSGGGATDYSALLQMLGIQ